MTYLRHASKHITSSHYLDKKKSLSGSFLILFLFGMAVLAYIFLRGMIGDILYSIRSIVLPEHAQMITLNPGAFESEVSALQVENEALKHLLAQSGVKIPGYSEAGANQRNTLFEQEIDIGPLDTEGTDTISGTATTSTDTIDPVDEVSENSVSPMAPRRITLEEGQVIASILVRPPQSPYDSLIINAGEDMGIQTNDQVYAFSGFPIGEVIEVSAKRSTVKLFSAPGSKIEVLIGTSTTSALAEGKGGGNFFLKLPKVSEIKPGDAVVRSYLSPEVFSVIESVDASEGEAYTYAYFKLPIHLNSLVYVLVKKNSAQ